MKALDQKAAASSKINMYVQPGLPADFDNCMGHKMCLRMLAEPSQQWSLEKEFEIRNSAYRQRVCMTDLAGLPSDLVNLCKAFLDCLDTYGEATILKIVLASMQSVRATSSHDLFSNSIDITVDAESANSNCLNPPDLDPELVECDCVQEIKDACGTSSEVDRCVQCKVCERTDLCSSWRQNVECDACPSFLLEADANRSMGSAQLLTQRKQHRSEELQDPSLEEADESQLESTGTSVNSAAFGKCSG
jgi:hypothetical protein